MFFYSQKQAFLLWVGLLFGVLAFMSLPTLVLADNLYQLDTFRASVSTEFKTASINASAYTGLNLSFYYDATTLDFGPPQDTFSYGYRYAGSEYILGTHLGLAGSTTAEIGLINLDLPESAEVADLEIFISVVANSTASSDKVELRNIVLTGQPRPIEIDVCLNLNGNQETIPVGYQINSQNVCIPIVIEPEPVDVCPNLADAQESIPSGYQLDLAGDCVLITPVVVDVCLNLPDVQLTIPAGYEFNSNLDCVEVIIPPITSPATTTATTSNPNPNPNPNPPKPNIGKQCPRGFSKWIDRFSERHVWRADDVYQAIILVGGPTNRRQNRDKAHFLYIAGPTEVGDKYYRRFHKIFMVCVKG